MVPRCDYCFHVLDQSFSLLQLIGHCKSYISHPAISAIETGSAILAI
jgi:hypothetical protein